MYDFMIHIILKKHKKYRLKPTLKEKIRGKLAIKKFKRKLRCMTKWKYTNILLN